MNYDGKFFYLIGKIGKLNLAKELNISYPKIISIENNIDTLTIKQVSIIEKLYDEQSNKK
jgi:hypothetical protein